MPDILGAPPSKDKFCCLHQRTLDQNDITYRGGKFYKEQRCGKNKKKVVVPNIVVSLLKSDIIFQSHPDKLEIWQTDMREAFGL